MDVADLIINIVHSTHMRKLNYFLPMVKAHPTIMLLEGSTTTHHLQETVRDQILSMDSLIRKMHLWTYETRLATNASWMRYEDPHPRKGRRSQRLQQHPRSQASAHHFYQRSRHQRTNFRPSQRNLRTNLKHSRSRSQQDLSVSHQAPTTSSTPPQKARMMKTKMTRKQCMPNLATN